jgi:uncharacterized protein
MLKLTPGYYTNRFSEIEAKWLQQQNIVLVLVDIDNTLLSDNQESAASAREWIQKLNKEGIKVTGTSNSGPERTENIEKNLGITILNNCQKPRTKVIQPFLREENVRTENVLILGDLLITDILCGNRLGIKTLLQMKPLKRDADFAKRAMWELERTILKKAKKI